MEPNADADCLLPTKCSDATVFDEYNVPSDIGHSQITSKRHLVYSLFRKLHTPLNRKGSKKELLCIPCLLELQNTNFDRNTWEKCAFKDSTNTSNLLSHISTKHRESDLPTVWSVLDRKRKAGDAVFEEPSTKS